MKYKAVICDLDGTLLNTLEDLMDSVNYGLHLHGKPEISLEQTRRFVGNGVAKLIERAVPQGLLVHRDLSLPLVTPGQIVHSGDTHPHHEALNS